MAKNKCLLFWKLLLCGIGSCMQWSETEWNTAEDGVISLYKVLKLDCTEADLSINLILSHLLA